MTGQQRRSLLRQVLHPSLPQGFGFDCSCAACSLPDPAADDRLRQEVAALRQEEALRLPCSDPAQVCQRWKGLNHLAHQTAL